MCVHVHDFGHVSAFASGMDVPPISRPRGFIAAQNSLENSVGAPTGHKHHNDCRAAVVKLFDLMHRFLLSRRIRVVRNQNELRWLKIQLFGHLLELAQHLCSAPRASHSMHLTPRNRQAERKTLQNQNQVLGS